jgi:hypothetical protein
MSVADQSQPAATYSSWIVGMEVKVDDFVVQIGEANILHTRDRQHQSKGGLQQWSCLGKQTGGIAVIDVSAGYWYHQRSIEVVLTGCACAPAALGFHTCLDAHSPGDC